MVMPTAVLPHETRTRCPVNDFPDPEPAVSVRNVHHPRLGAGDRQGDVPERLEVADGRPPGLKGWGRAGGALGRSLRGVDVLNAAAQHLFPAVGLDLRRVRRVDEVDQHPYESKRIVEVREVPRLGKELKSASR